MNKVWMFINVDWFFVSHRLPIALDADKRGVSLTVLADKSDRCPKFKARGFEFKRSPMRRRSSFYLLIYEFLKAAILVKKNEVDVLHAVTVKPILVIGIIARIFGVPFIASISGLGPAFAAGGIYESIRRKIIVFLYRWIFGSAHSKVIVQTIHDWNYLVANSICREQQITRVQGSGVDLVDYDWSIESEAKNSLHSKGRVRVLMASRLLRDKGVIEYLELASVVKRLGYDVNWSLAGPFDEDSPTALANHFVIEQCLKSGVQYLGNVSDMPSLLKNTDFFVFPSYYPEGLPKILLECAAAGVPVITTNHPGCRDVVIDGRTGLLVNPRDVGDLVRACTRMLEDVKLRESMALFSKAHAAENFDIRNIIETHFRLYTSASG